MRDISDDEQQSYRRESWLPFGLRRRRGNGFVAAPVRGPASPASLLRDLPRRRSQRGPRDFYDGLRGPNAEQAWARYNSVRLRCFKRLSSYDPPLQTGALLPMQQIHPLLGAVTT